MATSGRPRPVLGRLGALVLGLVLLAGGGCTGVSRPGATSADARPGPADPSSGPDVGEAGDRPCRVELPATWRAALHEGVVEPQTGETLTVALGLGDGTVVAVSDVPGVRHALVWRRETSGRAVDTVVHDFGLDHPEWQVLGATFDGRHLAYRVDRSYSGFEDFALYVWDSRGRRGPVEVAHGEPDARGELMQTPFVDPVLADGWLYWTQTRDEDPGRTVLSGYRLADGHVERLSRGYGRAPVRFGGSLVWADSAEAGQTSRLRALDLATHERVAVPAALAQLRGPYYLAGDQDTLAWVGGSAGQQVWAWRPAWPAPRLLVEGVEGPQFPRVAGDTVVFAGDDATFVGDLRSWSSAQLTPAYGGVHADGGPVVAVGYAPATKGAASVQALLDTTAVGALGRSGC